MKTTMTQFKYFTLPEYEKEQEYLRKQNKLGWKLTGITLLGLYHFEKCEPDDVVYQLDYNEDSTKHHEEYVQMFKDCNWEYVLNYAGYSYFRKPVSMMAEREEIFCDDSSRLDMIRRVFVGRMSPLLVIFFAIIIPQLFVQFQQGRTVNIILGFIYVALLVLYLFLFITFGREYFKTKRDFQ